MQEFTLYIFATYMLRAFLPLFWSVFLFFYRKRTRQNISLICIFFIIGLLYFYNSFVRQPALAACDVYNVRSYLILVFVAPFTIFYAYYAVNRKIDKRKYLLHFIPFAVMTGFYTLLQLSNRPHIPSCYNFNQILDYASAYPLYTGYYLLLMTVFAAQVVTYFSTALALLLRVRKIHIEHHLCIKPINKLMVMDFVFLIYPLFCMVFLSYNNYMPLIVTHNFLVSFFITLIAILCMELDLPLKTEIDEATRNTIPDEYDLALMKEIKSLMTKQKIYKDAALSLETLAKRIGVKRHYVSKAINCCTQKRFTDFVNEYRINEAIRLFSEKEAQKFSIDGIATETGFNDRKSFYRVFKKTTGQSPTEFVNQMNGLPHEKI